MPQFILPHGTPEASARYAALDAFTRAYIECAFFTDTGTGDDEELEDATLADLAPETWERMVADCAAFQANNAATLARAYAHEGYDAECAGHDYWYTRNGHGTGFWNRDLGPIGDHLADAARYHSVDLYMGDDGRVYLV